MGILLLLVAVSVSADGPNVEQAFRKDGSKGVVAAAKEIEKAKGTAEAVKALLQPLRKAIEKQKSEESTKRWPKPHRSLSKEDAQFFAAVIHALSMMGDEGKRAVPEIAAMLNKTEVAGALNRLGPGDIPIWLAEAALRPHDSSDAYWALTYLGLQDERLVPILERGLAHANLDVRWHAAVFLGDMGIKAAPARSSLVRVLEEEPQRTKTSEEFFSPNQVRAKAACALGCLGAEPEQTVRLLTKMLKHSDPEIRIWSAIGLGNMGNKAKAAIPSLVACLGDEKMILLPGGCIHSAHPDHSAATALVDIGSPALPALIQALSSKQALVKCHAADALWYFCDEAKPATDALLRLLRDEDAKVRVRAAHTLLWISGDAKLLAHEMVRLTNDKDSDVRVEAAMALGYLKPKEAVPLDPLVRLLDDPAPAVRLSAFGALETVAPRKVLESAIARLLKDVDEGNRDAALQAQKNLRQSNK